MKFGRRCQLSIEINPDTNGQGTNNIVIPSDFSIDFDICRQHLGSSQTASFRIANLGQQTRALLYKDPFATSQYRAIQFRAGYDKQLALAFNGWVQTASSRKEDNTVITEITAFDGGLAMANGFTVQTIASGITTAQLLTNLAKSLPSIAGSPIIGDFPIKNLRGKVLMGNTWNIIIQESEGLAIIDNGQVKVLRPNEAIVDPAIPVINAQTGLLGSPVITSTGIELDMLFEPRLTLGQIVNLESTVNPITNGTYKVMGFTHRGTISPVQSGQCTSHVSLWLGDQALKSVTGSVFQ